MCRFWTDEEGFSLTEMIVVTALMGFVLAAVFMTLQFTNRSTSVAERQAEFSRSIAAPMDAFDVAFSQNMNIVGDTVPPVSVTALDGYTATLEMPVAYSGPATKTYYRSFSAGADGRLTEDVYYLSGTTKTPVRTTVWSTSNVNRKLGKPVFTYYSGSGVPTTTVQGARSVNISLWTEFDGNSFSDSRRIYFRNR